MSFKGKVKGIVEGSAGIKRLKRKEYAILKRYGYDSPEFKAAQARTDEKDREGRQRQLDKSKAAKDKWTSDTMRWLQNVGKRVKREKKAGTYVDPRKESQKESSNHPFYQKVKALSRGKKSQSILEKRSKTIRFFVGKLKPCGEKSKVSEPDK